MELRWYVRRERDVTDSGEGVIRTEEPVLQYRTTEFGTVVIGGKPRKTNIWVWVDIPTVYSDE